MRHCLVTTPLTEVDLGDALGAASTGLLYYAFAYWLYLAALKHVTAALAGASFNLIPLVAIAGAYVLLGERLSGVQIAGALLIIVSGATLAWVTGRKAEEVGSQYGS
jgi:drug/metabolite transporter (DMT)-like permease